MDPAAGGKRHSRRTIDTSEHAVATSDHSTVVAFPGDPGSPGAARHYVESLLIRWGADSCSDDVALVVSELCTNSVTHARAGFTLTVDLYVSAVRIAVHDPSPEPPMCETVTEESSAGRGLWIVAHVARRWGFSVHPGGKEVWAEVAA